MIGMEGQVLPFAPHIKLSANLRALLEDRERMLDSLLDNLEGMIY